MRVRDSSGDGGLMPSANGIDKRQNAANAAAIWRAMARLQWNELIYIDLADDARYAAIEEFLQVQLEMCHSISDGWLTLWYCKALHAH